MTMSALLSQTSAHSFFSEQKTLLKQPLGIRVYVHVYTFLYVQYLY